MKTALKRIFSFVMVVCMAVIGMVSLPMVTANAAEYVETSFGEGKMLITTTFNGSTYYLPATTTSSGPSAKSFTDVNTIGEEHLWTVTATDGNYYIQNSEGKYLYTTNTNNGVRVGDTANSWAYDASENSFKDTGTSRYLGIYNASNWRCYTTVNQSNYKESSTSFKFYKVEEKAELPTETAAALNNVQAYMSLAYRYTETTQEVQVPSEVTDTLNIKSTGVTSGSTSYKDWTYESTTSEAVYAGQSAGQYDSIQLRSATDKGYSGVITTASGGKAKKIIVEWNSSTSNGRTLNVYGKDTAYTAATDLYNASSQGTLLGTIVKGTSTELTIDGDYEYIGFRSASGALYLTSVEIVWDSGTGGGTTTETVLENSEFRIKCGVDESLTEIADVDGYGIRVTAGEKIVDYTTTTAKSWRVEDGKAYVVINLGDIANELDKLKTEFTVQAYIKVGEDTYPSDKKKAYSVATMIAEYNELGYDVEHLYNYLQYLQEKEAA